MADISSDISDLWWLRQEPPRSSVPALALGANIAQHNAQNRIREYEAENDRIRMISVLDTQLAKKTTDTMRGKGMAEMSSLLATAVKDGKLTDPNVHAQFWDIGARYAPYFDKGEIEGTWGHTFEPAIEREQKSKEFHLKVQEVERDLNFEPRELSLPSGERLFELSPGKFQQARGNESIETWVDPTGQAHTRIIRGNTKAGDLTMATQSQVQQRLIGFEKTINMAADLYSKLDPSMLGVRGLMGEMAVDRGMAQAFPEMADKERINGRTLLRAFNESIIKSLKVDAQVNRDEEKRLLAALPSPGAVSSLPEAQEKIKTFMGLIKQQARIDAQNSGKAPPDFTLSLDEVAKKVVAKELTEQQGIDLINRYRIGQ